MINFNSSFPQQNDYRVGERVRYDIEWKGYARSKQESEMR
jgi:hypothetical protein